MAWATPNDATHSVPPTRAPSPPIRVNLEPGITHLLPLGRTVRQASGGWWCGNSPRFVRLGWADRLRVGGARGRRGRPADKENDRVEESNRSSCGEDARPGAAPEGAVDLVGGALDDVGLFGIGLGLGDGAGLDGRGELIVAVGDEGVDDGLDVDVVGLRHVGDGLARVECGREVGLADADRLGDDRRVSDRFLVATEAAAAIVTAWPAPE